MRVNFLDEEKISREIRWDQIFIVLAIILLLAAPALHFSYHLYGARQIENEIDRVNRQIGLIQADVEEHQRLEEQVEEYQEIIEDRQMRHLLPEALRSLGEEISADIHLEYLEFYEGEIFIGGVGSSTGEVLGYASSLERAAPFSSAEVENLDSNDTVDFDMHLEVKREGE
ncbi:PilN domain-containing protein [Halarsenatibacter silvermanii]|uniref:Type IV pilus assembly protein PilN n=1 Tax=Halarsenatibacter silvermanii TaxID=321763 RepID=A0A1G9LAL9_9FIRM|nr:hypothetical protein [Halarsenatibacter silvermanii]SDL58924.1 hypothetical protein SAMN04488692_1069 [Halarsenatibacter silvermanii]